MLASFKFLSTPEFERLSPADRLTYLSDAMEELERAKVPKDARGWGSLFSETQQQQQQQQQQQPQSTDDPKPGTPE